MKAPLDRDRFPVCRRWAYLDHAAIAPVPLPAAEAMREHALELARDGALAYDDHAAAVERVRAAAARLMGVPATDVAFVKNTTEGLAFVASGLDWKPGDRVVVPALDFPSTVFPWTTLAGRGVSVAFVHPRGPGRTLPFSAYAEVIDAGPAPRLVAVSWVQFARGWRTDLAELARLCRERGTLLCVDAIQGLGVLPARLEEWGVDFAAADGHKWMLGPAGAGVLYVRRSRLDLLRPLEPGWASVRDPGLWDSLAFDPDDTARRLEGGMLNAAGILGLGASLDLLHAATVERVWEHIDGLCDLASAELTEAGATILSDRTAGGRSGIVTFTVPGVDPETAVAQLRTAGVVCSARGKGLRISPHGYTTEEDIGRLVRTITVLARAAA
ncbi:aminotransferase class V-fold PLP-dependent enzyme [Actinomadura sp. KC216]|uniref:aminotransferase class V-fold PLP-dependent enzyme n=1 Tax=Actinomadura sp. KC216 TaxID=2530370 RepID=UPI0010519658|nr:aminotransferase class V-fold PLP-dependent enzyme [Actinomadura sp. KC216]TDB90684.1 aminotransferase class V-fold PLP-dependent enzyme [Actinomadura sp. KC216]